MNYLIIKTIEGNSNSKYASYTCQEKEYTINLKDIPDKMNGITGFVNLFDPLASYHISAKI